MIDSINANPYFKEALSYIDDELLKYQGDSELGWFCQAIVGLFGDLVDVEAIGEIDNDSRYFTQMIEGYSDSENMFSMAYWQCGEYEALAKLWQGIFLIISSNEQCNVLFAPINRMKLMLHYFDCLGKCDGQLDKEACITTCMPSGGSEEAWDCSKICSVQTENCPDCYSCCSDCYGSGDQYEICREQCYIDYYSCSKVPCYLCDIPGPPFPPPPY